MTAADRSAFADRLREWAKHWADQAGDAHESRFFPLFGTIVPGSGLAAGAGFRDNHVAGGPLGVDADGRVSWRRYQQYRVRAGLLDRRSDTPGLGAADENLPSLFEAGTNTAPGIAAYGEATYRKYPRQPLYGSGGETAGDDRAQYVLSGPSYELVVRGQLNRYVAISSRVGLFQPTVSTGEEDQWSNVETGFDRTRGAGLGRQPDFFTLGIGATFDGRDSVERPSAGSFLGVSLWRYASRGGAYDFNRFALDARHYATPFTARGVLAVRLLVSSSTPAAGSHVPFYFQYALGGNEALRGFGSYRFRDDSLAYLSAEYRWDLNRLLDIVPFVETAGVGPSLRATLGGRAETDAGIGARFKWGGKTFLRVDWARSREGNRLAFGTGLLF